MAKTYVIKTKHALDQLTKEFDLKLIDSYSPPPQPFEKPIYYQVFTGNDGNYYLFDEKHAKKEVSSTTKFDSDDRITGRTTVEGKEKSLCVVLNNLFTAIIKNAPDLETKIVQTRHPQTKLLQVYTKKIEDKRQATKDFIKRFFELTKELLEDVANANNIKAEELVQMLLNNETIQNSPTESVLKKVLELCLIKLDEKDDCDEVDDENATTAD